jgi:hydroxymethylpyrimidine/phosphomethylpyrimidine kinase
MSAVTAVTAQDARRVVAVHPVPPEAVRAQIRAAVAGDGVDAVKTGMLHSAPTVEAVAGELRRFDAPVVVDPVMASKSGHPLLEEGARETLAERLLPLATVATPNLPEAEALTGRRIRSPAQARAAARAIARMGPRAVVVKGGHLRGREAVDLLYHRGKFREFRAPRVAGTPLHGTGCLFASAIAAEFAKGAALPEAVARAKEFTLLAIRSAPSRARGSERERVAREVAAAARSLESEPRVALLVPEAQISVAMALPGATSVEEVAGIPGRIVKMGRKTWGVRASGWPEFGASHHVATAVLTAMPFDPRIRAGMNLRMGDDVVRAARALGLSVSTYDRRSEPPEVKQVENRTIAWGTEEAIRNHGGKVPDLFYHRGDWGKEPMVVLLGESATGVARTAVRIARRLAQG